MTEWTSEAGQDRWVVEQHPTPGYFVDVGAYDGIEHSNTYALEQLGWTGLCVEANYHAAGLCIENRKGTVRRFAASDYSGVIEFDGFKVGPGGIVPAARLVALLEEVEAPTEIGYMSIDVEGHELAVLAGMDFDRYRVGFITIEHNLYRDGPAHKQAIYDYLTARGFTRVAEDVVAPGYGPYEDWYRS